MARPSTGVVTAQLQSATARSAPTNFYLTFCFIAAIYGMWQNYHVVC